MKSTGKDQIWSFNVVDHEGKPAETLPCPYCGANLTIGFYSSAGTTDRAPSAVHARVGGGKLGADNLTGCQAFDGMEVNDFVIAALPRLGHIKSVRRLIRHLTRGGEA